jgi:hypothetical protein
MLFNKTTLPPVDNDQFRLWLDDPVTQHLFRDIENMYLDSMLDPLTTVSIGRLAIMAIQRDAYREMTNTIFDWSPKGVNKREDS